MEPVIGPLGDHPSMAAKPWTSGFRCRPQAQEPLTSTLPVEACDCGDLSSLWDLSSLSVGDPPAAQSMSGKAWALAVTLAAAETQTKRGDLTAKMTQPRSAGLRVCPDQSFCPRHQAQPAQAEPDAGFFWGH